MSGFEALGLACNIFQTICFARDTVVLCRDVYNGQKTPDSHLQENAAAMILAAQRVEASCAMLVTPEEQALASIARECTQTARRLEEVVRTITKNHKKGNVAAAFGARVKSLWKKGEIEDLDKAVKGYIGTMEVLLINRICDQTRANDLKSQSGFRHLDGTLQAFIQQISVGQIKLEELLRIEATATRSHITVESQRNERVLKGYISDANQSHRASETLLKQRERLLQSLKYPEMNLRRNEIMEPEDATFKGLFQSYGSQALLEDGSNSSEDSSEDGSGSSESYESIDAVWSSFVHWLRSDNSLFWIQGKPGSGKSTLIKHIIFNRSTQELLNLWNGGTRMVSHYFYMIGTPMQSNLVGFYCSLIHQLLSADMVSSSGSSLVHEILEKLPQSALKEFVGDWSIFELKQILNKALEWCVVQTQPLCIFVDGLDEFTGEEGQDELLDTLEAICRYSKVKVCVSSRPEPRLRERLSEQPNLRLHDLTWPDMEAYITEQLADLVEEDGGFHQFSIHLTFELLTKAEGVFLWLRLALQSVKSGIRNRDQYELLLARVQELPPKLEDLYEVMWRKSNQDTSVYRRSAARYLHLAIMAQNVRRPHATSISFPEHKYLYWTVSFVNISLFEIMCANNKDVQAKLLDITVEARFEELNKLCEEVEREIHVRCGGLLEIEHGSEIQRYITFSKVAQRYPQIRESHKQLQSVTKRVSFVHRTAHDFLTSTTAGKDILSHNRDPVADLHVSLSNSFLCFVRLMYQKYKLSFEYPSFLKHIAKILKNHVVPRRMKDVQQIICASRELFEEDYLWSLKSSWKPHFLSLLALINEFDALTLRSLGDISPGAATVILRELWIHSGLISPIVDHLPYQKLYPSIEVVRKLLLQGADPFAVAIYEIRSPFPFLHGISVRISTIWCILDSFDSLVIDAVSKETSYWIALVEATLEAWPNFIDHRWMARPAWQKVDGVRRFHLDFYVFSGQRLSQYGSLVSPIFEVSTSYLLKQFFARTRHLAGATRLASKLQEVQHEPLKSRPYLRFLRLKSPLKNKPPPQDDGIYFKVVEQKPLEAVMPLLFDFANPGSIRECLEAEGEAAWKEWETVVRSLVVNDPNVLKRVSRIEIWEAMAYIGDEEGTSQNASPTLS